MRSHLSGVDRTLDLFGEAPPEGASEAAIRDCWGTPDELFHWIIAGCGGRFADYRGNAWQDGKVYWNRPHFQHAVIDLFTCGENTKSPFRIDLDEGDDAFAVDWRHLCYDEECTDTSQGMNQSLRSVGPGALRFGNPPFSRVIDACTKARAESDKHPELDIVLIIPGPMGTENDRAGNSYANTHRLADAVLFLTPRVNFIPPPGIKDSSASGATTVLAWGPAARRFVERRNGANVEFHVEWK
jgi:hypothetical protein